LLDQFAIIPELSNGAAQLARYMQALLLSNQTTAASL